MPSVLHDELASLGAKWLKQQGFSVIATDLTVLGVVVGDCYAANAVALT